jgi:chromosome segregation and condensation protein ScpB
MTLETTEQKDDLRGAVEAILMITDSPISLVALATALEQPVNLVRSTRLHREALSFAKSVAAGASMFEPSTTGPFACSWRTKTQPS